MNSKMTTNSQLLTTKPKKTKNKNELEKQKQEENKNKNWNSHRNGDFMEGYQRGWGGK